MADIRVAEAFARSGEADQETNPWFRRASNNLFIFDDRQLTRMVAEHIVTQIDEVLGQKPYALITTSAGRTLQPTYALIRDQYCAAVDWKRVICVQMDEYEGLGHDDARCLAAEVAREFVEPLGITRFIRFYDAIGNPSCSLHAYEQEIRDLGGLDCAIHGVGRNGHIAFNEPPTAATTRTRVVQLSDSTRAANGVAFRRGVTLGLSILREARASVIVLRGIEKRTAAEALIYGVAGCHSPVTHLRDSARVSVFLDGEAAPSQIR